jgi:hypothetical protein
MTGAGKRAQVTGADEQRCAEERAEAGHRLDDRRLPVLLEAVHDLEIEALEALVEGEDVGRQLGDDAGGHGVAGQHGRLRLGCGDGASGDAGGVTHVSASQPVRQPYLSDATEPVRAGIAG